MNQPSVSELQNVLDHLTHTIFVKDRQGHYLAINKSFAKLAGASSTSELLGKTDYDCSWADQAEHYRAYDTKVMNAGVPELGIIEPLMTATGEQRWIETNKVPLRDASGEVYGVLGWFDDITVRKQREDRLAADEEKFRAIVETANEWMWEIDGAGCFTYSSPRIEALLGVSSGEVLGKPITARCQEPESFELLLAAGKPFSGVRTKFTHKDGHTVVIESSGVPLLKNSSAASGLRGISRDVSRQVEAERDLREKHALVAAQREAISRLSTPIMQVWDGVLCLPVVGIMDTTRSSEMTDTLLSAVAEKQARCVIVDVTGIEAMDTGTADLFIKMAKAIRLLGAHPVLTGISPGIAQTLAHLGVDLGAITTLRSLKDGLEAFLSGALDVFAQSREGA